MPRGRLCSSGLAALLEAEKGVVNSDCWESRASQPGDERSEGPRQGDRRGAQERGELFAGPRSLSEITGQHGARPTHRAGHGRSRLELPSWGSLTLRHASLERKHENPH